MELYEPIEYLEEGCTFLGYFFRVDRRTYVPTAETEILARAAVDAVNLCGKEIPLVIDVGTGCGVLAICVKKKAPEAEVWAIDVSKESLDVARLNGDRHGVNVTWIEADLLSGVECARPPVLIVANLPYGSSEWLLASNRIEEFRHYPPISTFVEGGLLGSYVRLCQQVRARDWSCTLLLETGVVSEEIVRSELFSQVPSRWEVEYICDGRERYSYAKFLTCGV